MSTGEDKKEASVVVDNNSEEKSVATEFEEDFRYTQHIDCYQAMTHAFECATPSNQVKQLYMYGQLDSCSAPWKDFFRCFRAKLMKPHEAREYVQGTSLDPLRPVYQADVWELKDKPSWKNN